MPQPHDRLFRQTFADAEHTAALLRACLPRTLARDAALDWATLRLRTADFVDEGLREHRTDEVFSVDGRGGEHVVVLEHKAWPDESTLLQILRYQLQIHERCRSDGLPPPRILPVVVHHGPKTWTAPTTLLVPEPRALHAWTDVSLLVLDFARRDEDAIRGLGLTDRGTATMLFLQVLRTAAPDACWPALQRWAALLRRVRRGRDGRRALGGLLTYALEITELTHDELADFAAVIGDHTDKDSIMSTADKLRALGHNEGLAKGRAEGRTEGRAEGQVEVLLRLMTLRFGRLPDKIAARIRAGSPGELAAWTERILTAPSLDALFERG